MDPAIRLGPRMRARRLMLGLTLAQVATDAGMSVPYVANLEKGRGNPTLDVLMALARTLGTSLSELLSDDRSAIGPIDERLADLPPALLDYARGKRFGARTDQLAAMIGITPEEMRPILLRALAATPLSPDRQLSEKDCRRILDAYTAILTDPGDT